MRSESRVSLKGLFQTLLLVAFLLIASSAKLDARATTALGPVQQGLTKVWVNTTSRVYHCPGTRYYGATKRGTFMTEAAARANGNRPAHGDTCGPNSNERGTVLPLGSLPEGKSASQVWVNTGTGVYHCPGSRYYRNTKRGELMTEADARSSGKRPAYGKSCGEKH